MSFHLTSQNIELEGDGHTLKAHLCNAQGQPCEQRLDLNTMLGNSDGRFDWSSEGFSHSAEGVSFQMEGETSQPILRARLCKPNGEFVDADVNLAERLGNLDGQFVKF